MKPRRLQSETILSIKLAVIGSAIRSDSVCYAHGDVKVPGPVVAQALVTSELGGNGSRPCVSGPRSAGWQPAVSPNGIRQGTKVTRIVSQPVPPNFFSMGISVN